MTDDEEDEMSADLEREEVEGREKAVADMAPELAVALTTAWRLILSLPNSHDWGARKTDVDAVERVVDKLIRTRGY